MNGLASADAYRLWAPSYSHETAVSFLENKLVETMTPALSNRRLLDAGCGTGRRIQGARAARVVGLDLSREMLAAGLAEGLLRGVHLIPADIRQMPLPDGSFDVIWCRLVLGHLPHIDAAYAELARVAANGATVIVTDFHQAAVDAGHRRTFRCGTEVVEVEHHVHRATDHIEAARSAGLQLRDVREAEIGDDARPFYVKAKRLEAFLRHRGLPVVLALEFRKVR